MLIKRLINIGWQHCCVGIVEIWSLSADLCTRRGRVDTYLSGTWSTHVPTR